MSLIRFETLAAKESDQRIAVVRSRPRNPSFFFSPLFHFGIRISYEFTVAIDQSMRVLLIIPYIITRMYETVKPRNSMFLVTKKIKMLFLTKLMNKKNKNTYKTIIIIIIILCNHDRTWTIV